ncbi:hypothetical protein EPN83_00235 [Patescibacteria group bacterium]|nr:MAG: hypothetical protein EPN83_00235 [Patescibacteria group bacterium]
MKRKRVRSDTSARANSSALSRLNHPSLVAAYFGFSPWKPPRIERSDELIARTVGEETLPGRLSASAAEKSALLRAYLERNCASLPHPLFFSFHRPIPGTHSKRAGYLEFGLEIFGIASPIAEAIGIRTAASILEDEGHENLELRLNSIGDKDSITDFERATISYIRKHLSEMQPEVRRLVRDNPFGLPRGSESRSEPWREAVPKSMSFLSDESREYFKEVLEYVEALGFSYRIAPDLVGNPRYLSHVLFEIVSDKGGGEIALASGCRYSRLAKRAGLKRELPCFGINIVCRSKGAPARPARRPSPRFYLMQIGFVAKLKTLNIIELLRRAKIPVFHSLVKDKLTSQMGSAENMKVSHLLIVGQKEALEDSVTVRDMNTREQETVPTPELAAYLKKLK